MEDKIPSEASEMPNSGSYENKPEPQEFLETITEVFINTELDSHSTDRHQLARFDEFEMEPGQVEPRLESSHEPSGEPSHEPTADESENNSERASSMTRVEAGGESTCERSSKSLLSQARVSPRTSNVDTNPAGNRRHIGKHTRVTLAVEDLDAKRKTSQRSQEERLLSGEIHKPLGDSERRDASWDDGTSYEFIGDLTAARGEAIFVDGSRYVGTWDALGMAGAGSYRMPHDVIYKGEIRDGMNHGQGTLEYPGKQHIDGVWNRGELQKWRYTFNDGLVYKTDDWTYCKFPDRRFYQCQVNGLNPAGNSLKTQDQPTKVIPSGCYDAGDGVFDPKTLCVTNFDEPSKILRIPTATESQWIMKHCRKGKAEPTGYQPWLNENWSSNPPEVPYRLPMSTDSPERWWKRIFTFERDTDVILDALRRSAERSADPAQSGRSSRSSEIELGYVGAPYDQQPESEIDTEMEGDVCGDFDGCGGDHGSQKSSSDKLREVVCEEFTFDEYEGEDTEDLLMTVCCPPKGTYTITKKKISPKMVDDEESSTEESTDYSEEEEDPYDFEGLRSYDMESQMEEEMRDENLEEIPGEILEEIREEIPEEIRKEIREEIPEEIRKEIREEIRGEILKEDGSGTVSDANERISSVEFKVPAPITKRQPKKHKPVERAKKQRSKSKKRLGDKKHLLEKKKLPCPDITDTERSLQRKVGDLLFSPALDAPRAPVYLVRKECDGKVCDQKSKSPKRHTNSKCGISSSRANSAADKYRSRKCNDDKITGSSDKKKICSSARQFVTIECNRMGNRDDIRKRRKPE